MRCKLVSPTDSILSCKTGKMLSDVIWPESRKTAQNSVRDYYRYINEQGLQGQSVIAFHTRINELKNNKNWMTDKTNNIVSAMADIISSMAEKNPEVKKEIDLFVSELDKKYPKTLAKRIALARQGSVVTGEVRPKSKFDRFMINTNEKLDQSKKYLKATVSPDPLKTLGKTQPESKLDKFVVFINKFMQIEE
ncbi:hypothetical protein J6E39_09215 [bacterium]|nr:hypothetical protein [bacterium]